MCLTIDQRLQVHFLESKISLPPRTPTPTHPLSFPSTPPRKQKRGFSKQHVTVRMYRVQIYSTKKMSQARMYQPPLRKTTLHDVFQARYAFLAENFEERNAPHLPCLLGRSANFTCTAHQKDPMCQRAPKPQLSLLKRSTPVRHRAIMRKSTSA